MWPTPIRLRVLWRNCRQMAPPLRGVIHAAGVLADGIMTEMTLEQLDRAMAPKVRGAWNLHVATRECAAGFLRPVFVGRQRARFAWAGELRGRQCLFGCSGTCAPRSRPAGDRDQLGTVGRIRHGGRGVAAMHPSNRAAWD